MVIGDQVSAAGILHGAAGQVDELAIWNRALSAAEVTQLYNSGAGKQYPF